MTCWFLAHWTQAFLRHLKHSAMSSRQVSRSTSSQESLSACSISLEVLIRISRRSLNILSFAISLKEINKFIVNKKMHCYQKAYIVTVTLLTINPKMFLQWFLTIYSIEGPSSRKSKIYAHNHPTSLFRKGPVRELYITCIPHSSPTALWNLNSKKKKVSIMHIASMFIHDTACCFKNWELL